MCHVKGIAPSIEPAYNYHLHLQFPCALLRDSASISMLFVLRASAVLFRFSRTYKQL